MNPYNIAESTKIILFQLIAISFLILCQTSKGLNQTQTLFLKQYMPFNITCHKNNGSKNPSKLELKLLGHINAFCLSGCEIQSSNLACKTLAQLTSNFYCDTGKYCDKNDQCNFMFNNATIGLDGYQLACTDNGDHVIEWQIKGIEK